MPGLVGWSVLTSAQSSTAIHKSGCRGDLRSVVWQVIALVRLATATHSVLEESAPSVDIDGREAVAVGGLVGYNHNERPFKGGGSITNSYANIRVEGDFDVGGLVGYNDAGNIDNSYALGSVIGSTNVGGLVGYSSTGTIVGHAGNNVTGANNVGNLVSPESGGMITESLTSKPTLTYSSDA